jgi:hypothetical protein
MAFYTPGENETMVFVILAFPTIMKVSKVNNFYDIFGSLQEPIYQSLRTGFLIGISPPLD